MGGGPHETESPSFHRVIKEPVGSPDSIVASIRDVVTWVRTLRKGPDSKLPYLITKLPSATEWNGSTLPVSNGAGGKPTVTALNGLWTYPDGTTV